MNFLISYRGTLRRPRATAQPHALISSAWSLCSRFQSTLPKAYANSSSSSNTTTSLFLPTTKGARNTERKTLPSLFTTSPPEINSSSLIPEPSSTPRRREGPQSGQDARNKEKRTAIRRRVHTVPTVEVSLEMASLVSRLYREGYLRDKNFLDEGKYDPSRISAREYSQGFLNAAVKFGKNKQEIAKSLSGYHLKKIALLGCPSSEKLTIFAAKSLRSFFSIQEDTTCKGCKIKNLCRFANKKLGGKQNLALRDVLLVVVGYILPAPNHSLWKQLSAEILLSISKVLKEINNLSL